jgi:outer membrane lipoprotein LolB
MLQRNFNGLCCCAGIALLLASCATPTPVASPDVADDAQQLVMQNQQVLRAIDQFRVTGGLGVWTDDQSFSTRIDWRQLGQDFNVYVEAPAGLASMRLIQAGGVASLQRGQQTPVTGRDASSLLQQALGLEARIPIEAVALWIRGLPGEASNTTFDAQGRLKSMDYRDSAGVTWRAKVRDYTAFAGTTVPALISATGGPYNLRIVLKSWNEYAADQTANSASQPAPKPRLKVPGR